MGSVLDIHLGSKFTTGAQLIPDSFSYRKESLIVVALGDWAISDVQPFFGKRNIEILEKEGEKRLGPVKFIYPKKSIKSIFGTAFQEEPMAVTHMADPIVKLKWEGFIFLVDKGILKYHKFICTCNWQYTCLIFMSKAVGIINFSSMFKCVFLFVPKWYFTCKCEIKFELNCGIW